MTKPTTLSFTEAEQARIFEAARMLNTTQVELIKWGALQAADEVLGISAEVARHNGHAVLEQGR
jgi:hypothetical protein